MKKIMLSSLVLLPLIVLLILTLGGMVVSKTSYIYVEKVEFVESDTLVLIKDGEENPTAQLQVNVLPLRATDKSVVFSSDDESIVTVDKDGVVTGLDYGTTFVRVTSASNGAKSAMRRVLVTDDAVHRVEISGAPELLYTNQTVQLSAKVYPQDAANVSVNWTSDNSTVLAVSSEGKLTPKTKGTAVITASSVSDPEVSASVTVRVKIPVTNIWIDDGSAVTISGKSAQFPEVHFNEGAEEEIAFTSSDNSIATVNAEGEITFLKAGTVTVTATVTGGTEKPVFVTKTYTSTFGAYSTIGFNTARLEVDFDEWQNNPLELYVVGSPEGADAAYDISFSEEGVLAYDAETKEFTVVGTSKNGVVVTVESRTADGKLISGKATVVVTRKATELAFTQEEISLSSARADLSEYLIVTEMHTDTISYSVSDPSIATIEGSDVVFVKEGTVTVTVRSAVGGAQAEVRVTFISNISAEDEEILVDENYSGEERVILDFYGAEKFDRGILIISPPEGYVLEEVKSDDPSVAEIDADGTKIVPKKGGYVQVVVSAKNAEGSTWEKTIDIFVHRVASEVSFAPSASLDEEESGFVTAKSEISFTEPVISSEDAKFEKKIVWSVHSNDIADITQEGVLTFKKAGSVQVKVSVYYGDTEETYETVSVRSTYGQAETFALYCGDAPVSDGQLFTLSDLGEKITFTVKSVFPSDAPFDLAVSPNGTASFSVVADGTGATFTALGVQSGERFEFTLGNASLSVRLAAKALSDKVTVSGWNLSLKNGVSYKTFDGTATLTATLSREDGVTPSNMKVEWSTDGSSWNETTSGSAFTVTLAEGKNTIYVRSADGNAEAVDEFSVEKLLSYADFGLKAEYSDGVSGTPVLAGSVASVKETGSLTITIPKKVTRFTLTVVAPDDGTYVGTVPESVFVRGDCGAWATKVTYDPEEVAFSFDIKDDLFTEQFSFAQASASDTSCSITVVHSGLVSVALTGYDMENEGDVFGNGYQQVRVFGKKSYYDGKTVNYYKVPLQIEGASGSGSLADLLTWTLTPYKGNGIDEGSPATVQTGKQVHYNGINYNIVIGENGEASLVGEDGQPAPDNVMWADAYSESGYARIYFGGFNGLSETDVREDKFGNFDYMEGESANADGNGYGLDGKPALSEEGKYLALAVSDGTENVKDGFNFNVVNDGVNVFDAAGYIANKQIVLQKSLYSPEDQEAAGGDASLILSSTAGGDYAKTLIYGNGYQVDMGAYNKANEDPSDANKHVSVNIARVYNTTLKGAPAKADDGSGVSEDTRNAYTIEVTGTHYYYVDFQALHRILVNDGVTTYIQNCVFRYMADCSVSLVWSGGPHDKGGGTAYIKNVIAIDSGDSTFEWTYGTYHFSGFVDVFNYKNAKEISSILGALGGLIEGTVKDMFKNEYRDYSSFTSYDDSEPYVNIEGFSKTSPSSSNGVWLGSENDGQGTWSDPTKGIVSNAETGIHVLYKSMIIYKVSFLTSIAKDNDFVTFKCHLKEENGALHFNAEHLAWHAARVYRDAAMVGWNIEDHVAGENTL